LKLAKHRRRRSQRGAELIEVSLILIPILGFIFLIFDLSFVIFMRTTFQHSVREGVRYGVTGRSDAGGGYADDAIKAVVKANSLGFLRSTAAANTIHVRFRDPSDGTQTDNSQGNIIQVSIEDYSYGPLTLFAKMGFPVKIHAYACDLMEAAPPTGLPPLHNPE
jgi:Flp pilus assembly protein TadG